MLFLSYSSLDWEAAEAVCATLERRGVQCWMAPRDILTGDEWASAILAGIESAGGLVLVFSAHANRSAQVRREVAHAARRGLAVLPLRLDDARPDRAFRLFDEEFALALDAARPLDDRIAQVSEAAAQLATTGGTSPPIERPSSSRLTSSDTASRASSRLLGTAFVAVVITVMLRALIWSLAIYQLADDDLDIDDLRSVLILVLPLHLAAVIGFFSIFVTWLAGACSTRLGWSAEAVARVFASPPQLLTGPSRVMRTLTSDPAAPRRLRWAGSLWWPLSAPVLGLTVFIPFWAATDEPPLPWLLGLDAVLIVLSLLMTSVSRTINRHVDRLSLRQEPGRPSEHVA